MVIWGASGGAVLRLFMFLLGASSSSLRALLYVDARKNVSCEKSRKEDVNFGNERSWDQRPFGVEKIKVRHRGLTAHARARYRCFLPDLAGLAGVRRVRPMPDLKYSSIPRMHIRAISGLGQTPPPTTCDFRCKNSVGKPSILSLIVEQ